MSETTNDFAIDAIDERLRQLDEASAAAIAHHARAMEVNAANRDLLLELKAQLGRKPRARKPRAVETAAAGDTAETPAQSNVTSITSPWPGFNAETPAA